MTSRSAFQPLNEAAILQRQVGALFAGLLRPGTYVGAARETLTALVHSLVHPLGYVSVEAMQDALLAHNADDEVDAQASGRTAAMPVILVHGYVMNRSAFLVMEQALSRAGFRHVHAFNYPQFTHGIPETAGMLRDEIQRVLARTGAQRCMIVAHSLGGIIARYFIQELGGEDVVHTLITLGTPHSGTYTAPMGIGPAASQVAYQSSLLRRLDNGARTSDVRYIAYYSDLDVFVVPAVSAKLTNPALKAVNIRVRDTGHLSMLMSRELIQSVVQYLSDPALGRVDKLAA